MQPPAPEIAPQPYCLLLELVDRFGTRHSAWKYVARGYPRTPVAGDRVHLDDADEPKIALPVEHVILKNDGSVDLDLGQVREADVGADPALTADWLRHNGFEVLVLEP